MIARSRLLFSDVLPADPAALPTEFRIFRAGENPTTKGTVIFDDAAAKCVMAEYAQQGVDCMIDLEHGALDVPIRPDSSDARGWFKLDVRNGELWATDVKWSPDGARRLAEKTQRYISPAIYTDDERRVIELINVALVAMPATHQVAPLVAANKGACAPAKMRHTVARSPQRQKFNRMNPEDVKAALEALKAGDGDKALALLEQIIAASAGGGAPPAPAGSEAMADTAETPPADPNDPAAASQLAALRKQVETATAAQAAEITRLTALVTTLTAAASAVGLTERRGLIAELVKLGVETPATAWEGEPEKLVPCKRLAGEPIAELRDRVKVLSARGPIAPLTPPPSPGAEIKLSKAEQEYCTKHGLTPEQFAARKAGIVKKATK